MALPRIICFDWIEYLKPLFSDERMSKIQNILANCKFYPENKDIFKVFNQPLDNIKVVIIGMDPYSSGQATGLAFAVNKDCKIPNSLQIIFNEIERDIYQYDFTPERLENLQIKTLEHWVKQGVMLLNSALTVEIGKSGSHLIHWRWFIEEIVKILSEKGVIFVLWGKHAQTFKRNINETTNYILESCHPVAECYGSGKFIGVGHFSKINELLKEQGKKEIIW